MSEQPTGTPTDPVSGGSGGSIAGPAAATVAARAAAALADPLARRSLAAVGGPLGGRAGARARSWPAVVAPLVALVSLPLAIATAQHGYCLQHGWNGTDQFWRECFSDLPSQYQTGHLSGGFAAYLQSGAAGAHVDQPVLTGALMSALGGLTSGGSMLASTRWYFIAWALLATVALMLTVWLTAASRPRHAVDAAHVALSPVLVMTALLSPDVLGVLLASAGLWAWSRRRLVSTGVLLGLAVMARTYPLLILFVLSLLALRTGRRRAFAVVLGSAVGAAVIVAVPFLLVRPGAVLAPYQAWWRLPAGLGSPWQVPSLLGLTVPAGAVTAFAVAGWLVALVAGALVALTPRVRPSVAEVSFVVVALVLVTGKSFPVQASLWLVPLAALCGLRWRDHLVWATGEGLHFVTVWLYVGGLSKPDRGLPAGWYAVFLLLRVVAVLYLVWRVWAQVHHRGGSPEPPAADELAGDFAGQRDRLLVRLG